MTLNLNTLDGAFGVLLFQLLIRKLKRLKSGAKLWILITTPNLNLSRTFGIWEASIQMLIIDWKSNCDWFDNWWSRRFLLKFLQKSCFNNIPDEFDRIHFIFWDFTYHVSFNDYSKGQIYTQSGDKVVSWDQKWNNHWMNITKVALLKSKREIKIFQDQK